MSFEEAFSATMSREGGYRLHNVKGDRGGLTYAGIARNFNPGWPGWAYIDRGEQPPTALVRTFYRENYWDAIRGDELPPSIAHTIFDFAVNSSAPGRPRVAVKLAQLVAGAEPDGAIGPKTIAALKAMPSMSGEQVFAVLYAIAKLTRYAEICNADKTRVQAKTFLLGWLNRTLGALK